MHSLSPYTLRCFDEKMTGPIHERYAVLDKVGTHDTFKLLKEFITKNSKEFNDLTETKQVYKFEEIVFNEEKRELYGWFLAGHYGVRTDIIDIKTGKVDFKKATNNAEIIRHYIHIYLPMGVNEGIALMHSYRGNGIKTLFFNLFNDFYHSRTKLTLQMNPLSYDKAMKEWEQANAKEIKLLKFKGLANIEDQIAGLGHKELILNILPGRNKTMGKLKDYLDKNSEQGQIIEILSPLCTSIRTVVEMNGKRRTFEVGNDATNAVCNIEFDADVKMVDGNPVLASTIKWCHDILNEFITLMYKDMGFEL